MYFLEQDKVSVETLREAYTKHAVSLHPSQHDEDKAEMYTKSFQAMEAEYNKILASMSGTKTSADAEAAIKEQINAVLEIPGTAVELCGVWLWVTAPRKASKKLKALNFRWSKGKERWYWAQNLKKGSWKGTYTMPQIYGKFGQVAITEDANA